MDNKTASYLKIIAVTKIIKSAVLFSTGIILVFLDIRDQWLDMILAWIDEEMMLPHSKIISFMLEKFEHALHSDQIMTTGIISLLYGVLLAVEGVGVWYGKRWAEWLMALGTSALIPFEIYHFWHKPTLFKVVVIVINTLIFLYLTRTLFSHEKSSPAITEERS